MGGRQCSGIVVNSIINSQLSLSKGRCAIVISGYCTKLKANINLNSVTFTANRYVSEERNLSVATIFPRAFLCRVLTSVPSNSSEFYPPL